MAIKQLEPYVNSTPESDPMVETIAKNKLDIGANAAGLPKVGKNGMGLVHVAGGVGGARG